MNLAATIHRDRHHVGWDNSLPPVATVAPGERVAFEVLDASGGQLRPGADVDDVLALDPEVVNPTAGPLRVEGARPGDALVVTIEHLAPSGWGWTAIIPGFGLLTDDFPDPAILGWDYDPELGTPAMLGEVARIPLRPFPGTIGVAPATPGRHDPIPPRRVGGNLDTRDLAAGATLWLPVEVDGALLSIGDTHAAQGDGEVCGTAIESAMDVVVTLDVVPGGAPAFPRFATPGPVTRHVDTEGYLATTGVGPDLVEAARAAVRGMIDLLGRDHDVAPEVAYMLCSVCADLRITELVDAPNWVVALYLPRLVLV